MAAIAATSSPSLRAEGLAVEPTGLVSAANPAESMPARVATGPAMPSCLVSERQDGQLDFQVSVASTGGGRTGAPSGRCGARDRAAVPTRTRYRAIPFAPDSIGRPGSLCPTFSPDGSRLFFRSNRPTGDRGAASESSDLWVVERRADGWGTPQALGPVTAGYGDPGIAINSPAAELDGYVSPEQDVLVFASDRPGGYGKLDLYVSHRVVGGWSPARNLGRGVNGPDDELCPQVTPDERLLIFGRSKGLFQVDAAVLDDATP